MSDYLVRLQKNKFIFDCKDTYIANTEKSIIILAGKKNSFDYRIDFLSVEKESEKEKPLWRSAEANFADILRLRNAIEFSDVLSSEKDKLDEFLDFVSSLDFDNITGTIPASV